MQGSLPAPVQRQPLEQRRPICRKPGASTGTPLPTSWQAIKQQAHQGFEQLLLQAGLPVNAGLSRLASFTANGLQWQQQVQQQQQREQPSQEQAPRLPQYAACAGRWHPCAPAAMPPSAGIWYPKAELAWPEAHAGSMPWGPHDIVWAPTALQAGTHAADPAWRAGWPTVQQQAACRAAAVPVCSLQPHWLQPVLQQQGPFHHPARPAGTLGCDAALGEGESLPAGLPAWQDAAAGEATVSLEPEEGARACPGEAGEQPESLKDGGQQEPPALCKHDSDLCASTGWQAGSLAAALGPSSSQVGASLRSSAAGSFTPRGSGTCEAAIQSCGLDVKGAASIAAAARCASQSLDGSGVVAGGAGAASSCSSGCLSALDTAAAAAEAGDFPELGPEASRQAPHAQQAVQQLQHKNQEASTEFAHGPIQQAVPAQQPELLWSCGRQRDSGELPSWRPPGEALPPPAAAGDAPPVGVALCGPAQQQEGGSVSCTAAAALARFEQLQQQMRRLQAGVPPAMAAAVRQTAGIPGHSSSHPTRHCSTVCLGKQAEASQAAGDSGSTAAAGSVQQVMLQAESFLEQAQALLQRLHVAATSPQHAAPVAAASIPRMDPLPAGREQPNTSTHSLPAQQPPAAQRLWQPQWQVQQSTAAGAVPSASFAAPWSSQQAAEPPPLALLEGHRPWSSEHWEEEAEEAGAGELRGQPTSMPGRCQPSSCVEAAPPALWETKAHAPQDRVLEQQQWSEMQQQHQQQWREMQQRQQQQQHQHHHQLWQHESAVWAAASEVSLAAPSCTGQPLASGRQPARHQKAATLRPLSYAQRLRAVAAARAPLAAPRQEVGGYVQAALQARVSTYLPSLPFLSLLTLRLLVLCWQFPASWLDHCQSQWSGCPSRLAHQPTAQ